MPAAGAFGVIGMDGAALERGDGRLDEAALVQRVGMDRDLHVGRVGHRQAGIDGGRRGAPVLVQLQPDRAGLDLLDDRLRQAGVALAEQADIHRIGVHRLQHPLHVPGARRHRGRIGAGSRTGAAADHRGDAAHQRLLDLLRADEVDMGVDAARGDDHPLARDHLGARTDDDRHARLDIGIAGLADAGDAAVLDADIGLDDAPMVDDQRIGDHGVDAVARQPLALPHAVADHLAAAELDLLAVDREILLDLDDQRGVGQPHAVADGRPEHLGISLPSDRQRHHSAPMILPLKP